MKAPLIHVASLILNETLAIMPAKLEAILHAIGPRLVVNDQGALDELLRLHSINAQPVLSESAIILAQGNGNGNGDDKPYRLTPEGVAVIPVRGTLMKRFGFLSAASGFTSYQGLMQAANAAKADMQVKALLFDIDSPGGTTHGCFELSDALYQMRGDKPMWACANDLAASAAYALASSADRIWLTRTAGVGSVGVFALHADQSGMDEMTGVKYTYVFAGEKKIDGNPHEPLAKSARADIQAEVDRENDIFIATVARNRGFASATVAKIAGTHAGVFFADNAVPLMADEVGTFAEALEALTAKVTGSKIKGSEALAIQTESGNNASVVSDKEAEQGKEPKGDTTMPDKELSAKKADDEAKKAADPKDDDDDDDQPQKDDEKDAKKAAARTDKGDGKTLTAPVEITTGNAPAKRIAELCHIAGAPELAADYLIKGYSVEQVIEKLSARRSKAASDPKISSFVADNTGAGDGAHMSVDACIEQARVMSANSGGKLTQSRCMERLLRANPDIYQGYLEERGSVAAQVAFTGGGKALTDYVLNKQRRYMANLGLGTTIEDVPARRAM